jgi:hypothetical protein
MGQWFDVDSWEIRSVRTTGRLPDFLHTTAWGLEWQAMGIAGIHCHSAFPYSIQHGAPSTTLAACHPRSCKIET